MHTCTRACQQLFQCCTTIHGYFAGRMAMDSVKNAQLEPDFASKPSLDFSSSSGDSKSRLSRLMYGSQTFILPETITLAGNRGRYGDIQSAYNVAEISLHRYRRVIDSTIICSEMCASGNRRVSILPDSCTDVYCTYFPRRQLAQATLYSHSDRMRSDSRACMRVSIVLDAWNATLAAGK